MLDDELIISMLGHAFGVATYAPPVQWEVGLLDEMGAELGGSADSTSYARVPWTAWQIDRDPTLGIGISNSINLTWPTILFPLESWDVHYVRVYDATGEVMATSKLTTGLTFVSGDTPTVNEGELFFGITPFKIDNC